MAELTAEGLLRGLRQLSSEVEARLNKTQIMLCIEDPQGVLVSRYSQAWKEARQSRRCSCAEPATTARAAAGTHCRKAAVTHGVVGSTAGVEAPDLAFPAHGLRSALIPMPGDGRVRTPLPTVEEPPEEALTAAWGPLADMPDPPLSDARANLDFYQNREPSRPDGDLIEDIHRRWWGQYDKLEVHHGYIQWLFPIREPGLNFESQPLTRLEAAAIRADPVTNARVLSSYRLMLDFYGLELMDEVTGVVKRKRDGWQERFNNMERRSHNNLRITRIIKSLGLLGYAHFQEPLVRLFLTRSAETASSATAIVPYATSGSQQSMMRLAQAVECCWHGCWPRGSVDVVVQSSHGLRCNL